MEGIGVVATLVGQDLNVNDNKNIHRPPMVSSCEVSPGPKGERALRRVAKRGVVSHAETYIYSHYTHPYDQARME